MAEKHHPDTIRLAKLTAAVKEMRNAQREFFRTRNPRWLERSKRAEKVVDQLLVDIKQPTLF